MTSTLVSKYDKIRCAADYLKNARQTHLNFGGTAEDSLPDVSKAVNIVRETSNYNLPAPANTRKKKMLLRNTSDDPKVIEFWEYFDNLNFKKGPAFTLFANRIVYIYESKEPDMSEALHNLYYQNISYLPTEGPQAFTRYKYEEIWKGIRNLGL